MSEPVSCNCGSITDQCDLNRISVYVGSRSISSEVSPCGLASDEMYGVNMLGTCSFTDPEPNCGCDGSSPKSNTTIDFQGVYENQNNRRTQYSETFNGVTNTTTRLYGEPQILNNNTLARSTCGTSFASSGSPTYACDESGEGTFIYEFLPANCISFNMSAFSAQQTMTYGLFECGADQFDTVDLTRTWEISGEEVSDSYVNAKSLELLELLTMPTLSINNQGQTGGVASGGVRFLYFCPEAINQWSLESSGCSALSIGNTYYFNAFGCLPDPVANQNAIVLSGINRTNTVFNVYYRLPTTCYLKIWHSTFSQKNGTLISEPTIESTVVKLPQKNSTCIDRDETIITGVRITGMANESSLRGLLTTEELTPQPNDGCCPPADPENSECGSIITKNFAVLGWSIIDGYEPQFYTVNYDPEVDPDPSGFLSQIRNYYSTRVSSSRVIFSPFNDYSPTSDEQKAFDDALAAYNASKGSAAP